MSRQLTVAVERFPLAAPFVISRGARSEATVVTVTITEAAHRGRGGMVVAATHLPLPMAGAVEFPVAPTPPQGAP